MLHQVQSKAVDKIDFLEADNISKLFLGDVSKLLYNYQCVFVLIINTPPTYHSNSTNPGICICVYMGGGI